MYCTCHYSHTRITPALMVTDAACTLSTDGHTHLLRVGRHCAGLSHTPAPQCSGRPRGGDAAVLGTWGVRAHVPWRKHAGWLLARLLTPVPNSQDPRTRAARGSPGLVSGSRYSPGLSRAWQATGGTGGRLQPSENTDGCSRAADAHGQPSLWRRVPGHRHRSYSPQPKKLKRSESPLS